MKKIIIFLSLTLSLCCLYGQDDGENIYQKGLDAYQKKNLAAAREYFEQYIMLSPDSAKGYYSKGEVLLVTKELETDLFSFKNGGEGIKKTR